jgi:hypothetical protein
MSVMKSVFSKGKQLQKIWGIDHEVEFHEIKIQLFQEIDKSIMRSKFLIMS